ncbi:MAG: D-glycero-alpha-D-manno-heptose-1,7-bisphosphate 7-phosphatase [Nitrospinota bacterium]
MGEAPRPGVLLDRDGTLCEEMGYLNHLSRLRILPGSPAGIRMLNEAGVPVAVVTNQGGVGAGYFPESFVDEVHREIDRRLAEEGARIDAYYYSPYHPHGNVPPYNRDSDCRKPKPGLAERAARDLGLDLGRSYVVGDRGTDLELARRIGARCVLVLTGYGRGEWTWNRSRWAAPPDAVAEDLAEAARWILSDMKGDGG